MKASPELSGKRSFSLTLLYEFRADTHDNVDCFPVRANDCSVSHGPL